MKTSVRPFDNTEMGKLAHALLAGEERARSGESLFFTYEDESELAHAEKNHRRWKEDDPFDEDGWRRSKILCFVDRLWVANQVAYHYQYNEETMDGLDRLEEEDVKNGAILMGHTLHRELCNIRYNVYTNGGNSFLGPKDMDRLDHLVNTLADRLARAT